MHVVHMVDVAEIGGIERNSVQLMRETQRNGTLTHSLLADSHKPHPYLQDDINQATRHFASIKHKGSVKVPRWPASLRKLHHDQLMRQWQPDLALLWHWFGDIMRVDICRRAGIPVTYRESGLAWGGGGKHTEEFMAALSGALPNCHASKRILELRWDYRGDSEIIFESIIPRCPVEDSLRERSQPGETFTMGIAGRFRAFKGINIALHTLAELRKDGRDVCLKIAGEGPLDTQLRQLAEDLGVADRAHFIGVTNDMPAFYQSLDCYLHPALREPFGTVCAEAQVYGCPVLTTRVDGMPEVVLEDKTGYSLPATLAMDRFAEFGGDPSDVHSVVYDPDNDCLRPPAFAEPAAFAERIVSWMENRDKLSEFRHAAVAHARETFDVTSYLARMVAALKRFKANSA